MAVFCWFFLTPSVETLKTFQLDWIAFLTIRNTIIILVYVSFYHYHFYVKKTQGNSFKYNARFLDQNNPKFWFKKAKVSKVFDVNLNRFKVASGLSREHWIEKGWIFKEDPLGWFQWYCRFSNGRRISHIDEIQIKRWKNFRRHVLAIEKNCEKGDLGCRKRQRQAILQWAYNPYR